MAEVTLPWANAMSAAREFDVLVGAPPDVMRVGADSPYYAGTSAFFGNMMQMKGMPGQRGLRYSVAQGTERRSTISVRPKFR